MKKPAAILQHAVILGSDAFMKHVVIADDRKFHKFEPFKQADDFQRVKNAMPVELNPDEYLNGNLKNRVHSGTPIRDLAHSFHLDLLFWYPKCNLSHCPNFGVHYT
jgi:hypothetical protein